MRSLRLRVPTLLGLLVLIVLLVGAYLVHKQPRWLSRDLCAKIRPGMPFGDVVGIMGRSPGDYSTKPHTDFSTIHSERRKEKYKWWSDARARIGVEFDQNDNVVEVVYEEACVSTDNRVSFFRRIFDWLG